MTLNLKNINLPINSVIPDVLSHLEKTNTLLVKAPPGAGKSTILPLALLEEKWLDGQRIVLLEPRRLAAKAIAFRMANLMGEKIGVTVGYHIRFDKIVSPQTRILVVTEGILSRMLQADNSLDGIGIVIFDEFHERNLFSDIALALSRDVQQVLRPNLRLMIMSATLETSNLATLLQCPTVISEGKQYDVSVIYTGEADIRLLSRITAEVTIRAAKEQSGDILVFLPGEGEIKICEAILKKELNDFKIHPLYGLLNNSRQNAALMPDKKGFRKIVLATSIAETSLTIEGITTVVDCGYRRTMRFNARSGLSHLETIKISKDAAEQRAGRAGRLRPGVCYRMWNKVSHERRSEHRQPEIMKVDLASFMLDMMQWGVSDLKSVCLPTLPPKGHVLQATQVLSKLKAIENNRITKHGRAICQLPCHPRLANMLIMAKAKGLSSLASDLTALLEERDPLYKQAGADINIRINLLRASRRGDYVDIRFKQIERVAAQYRKMLSCVIDNSLVNPDETGLLVAYAFPEQIAQEIPSAIAQFKLANGIIAAVTEGDSLSQNKWLAVANIFARDSIGRIFLASSLNPDDITPFLENYEYVIWNTKKGGINAYKESRVGNIVLQRKPIKKYDVQLRVDAICKVLEKEGEQLLNFSADVVQLQNRITSLRIWNDDERWPDVSNSKLLASTDTWLAPYIRDVKKPEELKKLDIRKILYHNLPVNLQKELDNLAPERILVPSGSKIKLLYNRDSSPPVLAVRLQEVFGMEQTPTINGGRNRVLMHILSPGFKQVQVTSDLLSFWNNAYFEVRKELRKRYPKHEWPESPITAKPIRGVKRRGHK